MDNPQPSLALSQSDAAVCAARVKRQHVRVLDALAKRQRTATELAADLDLPQALLAGHLHDLENCGLVLARRLPTGVHYALADRCTVAMLGFLHVACRETT